MTSVILPVSERGGSGIRGSALLLDCRARALLVVHAWI